MVILKLVYFKFLNFRYKFYCRFTVGAIFSRFVVGKNSFGKTSFVVFHHLNCRSKFRLVRLSCVPRVENVEALARLLHSLVKIAMEMVL